MESSHFNHTPHSMLETTERTARVGEVRISMQTGSTDDGRDGMVRLTAASREEEKPDYDFHVTMLALLHTKEGSTVDPTSPAFQALGVHMLFPYLREAVASITMRGRFGLVTIAPFDVRKLLSSQAVSDSTPSGSESMQPPYSARRAKATKRTDAITPEERFKRAQKVRTKMKAQLEKRKADSTKSAKPKR